MSEDKWNKMNYNQRKYFLVHKHGFSSKYIDYHYNNLTTRQKNLLKEHTIRKEGILKLGWKKGNNFILIQSASGWGIKGLRRGQIGIVAGGGDDVTRVYFPKIKKFLNLGVESMERVVHPVYKWSKGTYPNVKCIKIKR